MEEFFNSLGNARNKARKFHYKCLCPTCSRNAINSHLIQQHPYLESIAEDGYLYQIKDNEIDPRSGDFSDSKEQILSIRQVLSMPLFCSEHDNGLFKPIESGDIDFNSTNTFLLFSLRGIASQRYLEDKRQVHYQNTGFEGEPFDVQREYSKYVIGRFDTTLNMLMKDIAEKSYGEYVFNAIDLPWLPVCGSDAVVDEDEMVESYYSGNLQIRAINTLYITLLPLKEKRVLKLIIGYHIRNVGMRQKNFYQYICSNPNTESTLQCIYRMKNWCGSPSYFKETGFADVYEAKRIEIIMENGGC